MESLPCQSEVAAMRDGEKRSTEGQAFETRFPSDMPLGQKVFLTVFFACTEGEDRRITDAHRTGHSLRYGGAGLF
jgi:hypothetical protein